MKNQWKHMIIMLVVLLLAIAGVFLARWISAQEEKKNEENSESTVVFASDFDSADVSRIDFYTDTASFALIKEGDNWTDADGTQLDSDKVDSFLNSIKNIGCETKLENVAKEDYGISENANYMLVTLSDKQIKMCIGDLNEMAERYYFFTDEHEDSVFMVTDVIYNLFGKTPEDFLPEETEDTTETEIPETEASVETAGEEAETKENVETASEFG